KSAEAHILAVLQGNVDELELSNLRLGTLPDLFDHPDAIRSLRFVTIENCQLDTLPPSLLWHPTLETLDARYSGLHHLPEFGEMPNLSLINLSNNRLSELPESIGRLVALTEIKAEGNRLESLPASIGRLANLVELDVSTNHITRLPDTLGGMRSLATLDVSTNPIGDLPESLRQSPLLALNASWTELRQISPVLLSMSGLEDLLLEQTLLTTLPPEIAQMSNLRELNVAHCEITSLPEEIVQLPEQCSVNLTGNPLSEAILNNLRQAQGQGGPQIHFSVDEGEEENHATQPLEVNVAKWLNDLSPEQSQMWQRLGNDTRASHFNTWLELMDQTADYRNEQTRPRLEQRMQQLLTDLTRMLETPADTHLALYLGIAEEATSTCRDRIAVGLNNMEMQQINVRASRGELSSSQLMTLGREMFIREQISQIAAEKVKGLRMVDEVEVHLAFQVGLQESMGLTLGNQDMLYRACSQVGDDDLQQARQDIEQQLNTPGPLRDFLADWAPLREFVKQRHADDWQAIEHSFQQREDQAYGQDGDTDWKALEALGPERERAFHALCAQKVDELLTTDLPSSSRPPEEPSASKRPRLE
ncbi:MAG TPA: NEL-type E3 ubiquitin ligase domain-containing protein, partial [Pseudomonas sp.]|uniref:NEL-type E3 ubiquitin ligase domain-containing protein n=1 Tax=Pseudomonas sp. TaxID=306 RepID=UPI002C0F5009